MKHAEKVEFVPDENGWELHVTDENGFISRWNVHGVAWDLAAHARETLGAWRAEGEGVQASARDELSSEGIEAYPPGHFMREDVDLVRDMARGK